MPHVTNFWVADANTRLLALIRVIVGIVAVARGVGMLVQGIEPLLTIPLIGFAVLVTIGWHARLAAIAALIAAAGVVFDGYKNHYYLMLIMLLLVALSDCERHYAIRPRGRGDASGWALALMQVQATVVYGFAGLAKVNDEFLGGARSTVLL